MNVLFEKVAPEGKSCTELTVVNGKFIRSNSSFFLFLFKKKLFTIYIFSSFLKKKKKTAVASNK